MKNLKKKVISAALALGILAVMMPAAVFADGSYTAQLVMEATSENGEFPKPGDQVKVSFYMQNAGWAKETEGTGWGAGLISLTYNQNVLQYIDFTQEKIVSDVFDDMIKNHVDHGATGEVLWMGTNKQLTNEVSFTNEKTKLGEMLFKVKDNLPQNLDGVLDFAYPEKIDFQFGDLDRPKNQVPGIENAVITPVFHSNIKFDTTAPIVTLDGTSHKNFYYSPVTVEIKETSGVGSVTLNAEPLSVPYAVSKSGTLVVTDKQGNSTTIEIVIDDAAYLAAKTAIEKLPENIGCKDEALVAAARKAVDAVTNQTAKGKLNIARLETAETTIRTLKQEKAALVREIAEANFTITLQKENVAAIEALHAKVEMLKAKGAFFTPEELKNLTTAKTAMDELQKRSQAAHAAIAALPTADRVVWANKDFLANIKNQLPQLSQLGDVFTESEQKKMAEVEAALKDIQAAADQLKAEMEALPDPADSNSANLLDALEQKIAALKKRGYIVDESTMGTAAMSRYNAYKEAVESLTASNPAPTLTSKSTSSVQTGDILDLPWLVSLLVLFGIGAFLADKNRKKDL